MSNSDKEYTHNGKTVKILPVGRKKKDVNTDFQNEGNAKVKRVSKPKPEPGQPKYVVGNKVALKNIPPEYSGAGFTESVVIKVFKSSYDQNFRYTIRGTSGQELPMLPAEQLKPYK